MRYFSSNQFWIFKGEICRQKHRWYKYPWDLAIYHRCCDCCLCDINRHGWGYVFNAAFSWRAWSGYQKAISLGLFFVIFSSFGGFVSISYNGLIDYKVGAILSVGGLVGVYFGTLAHHKIEKHKQKLALMGLNIITFSLVMRSIFLS